ncbi:hypothetical protein Mkiyose1088_54820 [Mycobacterium kiyosense]|nr:hypothetical protein Mkiyose1088_54820 [Mycobacterium kiyosense]
MAVGADRHASVTVAAGSVTVGTGSVTVAAGSGQRETPATAESAENSRAARRRACTVSVRRTHTVLVTRNYLT